MRAGGEGAGGEAVRGDVAEARRQHQEGRRVGDDGPRHAHEPRAERPAALVRERGDDRPRIGEEVGDVVAHRPRVRRRSERAALERDAARHGRNGGGAAEPEHRRRQIATADDERQV